MARNESSQQTGEMAEHPFPLPATQFAVGEMEWEKFAPIFIHLANFFVKRKTRTNKTTKLLHGKTPLHLHVYKLSRLGFL